MTYNFRIESVDSLSFRPNVDVDEVPLAFFITSRNLRMYGIGINVNELHTMTKGLLLLFTFTGPFLLFTLGLLLLLGVILCVLTKLLYYVHYMMAETHLIPFLHLEYPKRDSPKTCVWPRDTIVCPRIDYED